MTPFRFSVAALRLSAAPLSAQSFEGVDLCNYDAAAWADHIVPELDGEWRITNLPGNFFWDHGWSIDHHADPGHGY